VFFYESQCSVILLTWQNLGCQNFEEPRPIDTKLDVSGDSVISSITPKFKAIATVVNGEILLSRNFYTVSTKTPSEHMFKNLQD